MQLLIDKNFEIRYNEFAIQGALPDSFCDFIIAHCRALENCSNLILGVQIWSKVPVKHGRIRLKGDKI